MPRAGHRTHRRLAQPALFLPSRARAEDWPVAEVLAAKRRRGARISVVIPARNESSTIGGIVAEIKRALVDEVPLVDELVVMDSYSDDATAERAAAHGAATYHVTDVRPDLGGSPGKGEALWKSTFVTTGDLLVFIDADLTDWGSHFVTGLVGPLLADGEIQLVKGFYDRVLDDGEEPRPVGGRVTELVARPLITLGWPHLSGVVQPLAGEWAVRRAAFAQTSVPVGYGVEMALLLDVDRRFGLDAIAQVDLGRRAHRHQSVHDLGVMATEILHVAQQRRPGGAGAEDVRLCQFDRSRPGQWRERSVPLTERPPAATVDVPVGRSPG